MSSDRYCVRTKRRGETLMPTKPTSRHRDLGLSHLDICSSTSKQLLSWVNSQRDGSVRLRRHHALDLFRESAHQRRKHQRQKQAVNRPPSVRMMTLLDCKLRPFSLTLFYVYICPFHLPVPTLQKPADQSRKSLML